ncbi:MAG: hypothetical protein Kow00127_13210 [Bacteroidales bacterium]
MYTTIAYPQGCADAGGCSTGILSGHGMGGTGRQIIAGYSQQLGLADQQTLSLKSEMMLTTAILPGLLFEARVPYVVAIGNLATTAGVGDLSLALSYNISRIGKNQLWIVAGTKLKSMDSDLEKDNRGLPMIYQPSLGTNDFIGGLAFDAGEWQFSAAWQHPFNANKNSYLHDPEMPDDSYSAYYESAGLKRGDDLLLRIQRDFSFNRNSGLMAGLFPLWRLQQDEILRNGTYEKLENSSGLTLNIYLQYHSKISDYVSWYVNLGAPAITREYRADGLTRTVVSNAGLVISLPIPEPAKRENNPLYDPLENSH